MIADNDPRWVWDMDPRQSFGALTAYRGNRQVSDMVWANWTDPGVLPVNDGVNQTFERVLDPEGSGQYVYRLQIHKDRAVGSAYLPIAVLSGTPAYCKVSGMPFSGRT
jgi:hypothetical protein